MAKFKNKKTKAIIEENLTFYIDKLRNNPNFEELKEKDNKKKSNQEEKLDDTQNNEDKNNQEESIVPQN